MTTVPAHSVDLDSPNTPTSQRLPFLGSWNKTVHTHTATVLLRHMRPAALATTSSTIHAHTTTADTGVAVTIEIRIGIVVRTGNHSETSCLIFKFKHLTLALAVDRSHGLHNQGRKNKQAERLHPACGQGHQKRQSLIEPGRECTGST